MNRREKLGLGVLGLMVGSCCFLLVSPFIPNVMGQWLDDQYFQAAQQRIEQVRKGTIRIRVVDSGDNPLSGISLGYNLTQHNFSFGAMFFHYGRFSTPGYNETYAARWANLFNYATLPFYWTSWESPDYYPEEPLVNLTIAFCQERGIQMKGHTLVWNHEAGIPSWLTPITNFNQDQIRTAFQDRIVSLTRKYQQNISTWDVVNEAFHRGLFGLDVKDFTHQCFTWARTAVPGNTLVLNDYSMMGHDFGEGEMAQFCRSLVQQGTPYDAIGTQSHNLDTDWVPTYEIWNTLDGFSTIGKKIHVTELFAPSVPVPITNSWKKGLWSPENQAEYTRRFYTAAFSHPACDAITWWGFEDGSSDPMRNDGYGIMNADLTPKPAYDVLDQLINHDWHTEASGVFTNATGWVEFRGFYGTYNVTIGSNHYQIAAKPGQLNDFTIKT